MNAKYRSGKRTSTKGPKIVRRSSRWQQPGTTPACLSAPAPPFPCRTRAPAHRPKKVCAWADNKSSETSVTPKAVSTGPRPACRGSRSSAAHRASTGACPAGLGALQGLLAIQAGHLMAAPCPPRAPRRPELAPAASSARRPQPQPRPPPPQRPTAGYGGALHHSELGLPARKLATL